jgi:hypothetical protein
MIRFEHLTKWFATDAGQTVIVDDLSLTLPVRSAPWRFLAGTGPGNPRCCR